MGSSLGWGRARVGHGAGLGRVVPAKGRRTQQEPHTWWQGEGRLVPVPQGNVRHSKKACGRSVGRRKKVKGKGKVGGNTYKCVKGYRTRVWWHGHKNCPPMPCHECKVPPAAQVVSPKPNEPQ